MLNILSTIIIQGLAFFASPIFSRMLGTDNYGIVSIYNTWTLIVSAIFSLQVNSTLQLARNRFPIEDQEKYQSSVLGLGSLTYLLFLIPVIIFINPISALLKLDKRIVYVIVAHSYGQFCVSFLNAKYTYEFKPVPNFILSVFTSVCTVGLSIWLIYLIPQELNYWGRILGQAITFILLAIVSWVIIFGKGKLLFKKEYWKFCLPLGLPLIFHTLSNHLLSQSDRVMLQHMTTDSMVGIYSLAATFSLVLNVVWSALNNSWAPFYYEYTRLGEIDSMRKRAKRYIELFSVLSCGFVLLAPEVFHLYADSTYWDGTVLIPIFAVGYYMVFLYSFAVNYEFYREKTKLIAFGTLVAAILNVLLNYFFIRLWGHLGAAIATAIAHGLQFGVHYIIARYYLGKEDFPFRMKDFALWTGMFLFIAALPIVLPDQWVLRWGLGVCLGAWELYRIYKRKAVF